MKKSAWNPILYLHEYRNMSEEYIKWKNDENLKPWREKAVLCEDHLPEHLCVGIITYNTQKDGEILFYRGV